MTQATEPQTILAPQLPLSILHVEDNPDDAQLCQRILKRAQLDVEIDVVATPSDFRQRLKAGEHDIILSDYNLGSWTGMEAFDMSREEGCDNPFILVTGSLNDRTAVECIQSGVADYILKDRMDRLPYAVLRAIENRGLRLENELVQRSLRKSEEKFRSVVDAIPSAVFVEEGTQCRYVNRAAKELTGYSRQELYSTCFWQLLSPESRKMVPEAMQRSRSHDAPRRYDVQLLTKQSQLKNLCVTVKMFPLDGSLAALITAIDLDQILRGSATFEDPEGNVETPLKARAAM